MCCFIAAIFLVGPRFGILVWWLVDQTRWNLVFDNFVWPFLGFIFVPWTTLAYVLAAPSGIDGFDWVWLGIGILLDVAAWTGGGWSNRGRVQARYDV